MSAAAQASALGPAVAAAGVASLDQMDLLVARIHESSAKMRDMADYMRRYMIMTGQPVHFPAAGAAASRQAARVAAAGEDGPVASRTRSRARAAS